MQNTKFLVQFLNNEAEAGLRLNWPEYAKYCGQFAQQLEANNDLSAFITEFKQTNFDYKDVFLETLEQDAERPDLATMLGHSM
jgi:hypothetical protein